MKTGRLMILLCLLLSLAQCAYYWPRLPATMASHFGANGQANGWQSKAAFFGFDIFIVLLLTAVFLGMPLLLRRMPISLINLPNKDYWLSPERREESLAFLQDQLETIGASALMLVVVVMQMAIIANLNASSSMSTAMLVPAIAVFLAIEMICTLRMLLRFSARPKDG